MRKIIKTSLLLTVMMITVILNLSLYSNEAYAYSEGYDLNKIKQTSENVSIDSIGVVAKEYSIPILVICVVLSGFLAIGGMVFKPLKLAAGSLLGIGILFFILVNYAPEISGILISVVDNVMSRITGGI